MFRLIVVIFLAFLLLSCGEEQVDGYDNVASVAPVGKIECNIDSIPNCLGVIASDGIGVLKVNQKFPSLSDKTGYEVQSLDQIISDNDKAQKNTIKINHLFYNVREVMTAKVVSEVVSEITTYDKRFYTSECINIGKSFKDLLSKYTIDVAFLDNEEQMVYVSVLELGNVLFGFSQEVIIDNQRLDRSIGVVHSDNLDTTKGSVINIKVISK